MTWRFLLSAALIVVCGCSSEVDDPFVSRPTPAPDGKRLALTARGRIWVAEPEDDEAPVRGSAAGGVRAPVAGVAADSARTESWVARPAPALPVPVHQDRPVWFPDGRMLAFSIWVDQHADLAILENGRIQNLTRTVDADELLCDVSPDGERLLFERDHELWELWFDSGDSRRLVPGRDGRYAADGRHVLFVVGNSVSPLGIWREGYRGGDDSEIHVVDSMSGAVFPLTSNEVNDEQPIPLDRAGRHFVAISERLDAYHPWVTFKLDARKLRIRRPRLPESDRPVRFPAVRELGPERFELWMEQEGRIYRTTFVDADSGLTSTTPVHIDVTLVEEVRPSPGFFERIAAGIGRNGSDPGWFGATLFQAIRHALIRSPLTASRWRAIPTQTQQRFESEMSRVISKRAAVDLSGRLLGRFGMSHLYYEPQWGLPPLPPVALPGEIDSLAAGLARHGLALLPLRRLDRDAVEELVRFDDDGARGLVLDLRDNRGGFTHDAILTMLCGAPYDPSDTSEAAELAGNIRLDLPVIALISEHTYSSGEILADGVATSGCGRLVGRKTAGAVLEAIPLTVDIGGRLFVPRARIERRTGGDFEGQAVMPQHYVPPLLGHRGEDWLGPTLEAARALGVAVSD